MKYMGSKSRFAKDILEIVLFERNGRPYLEPFAGGMNIICEVPEKDGPRYANDANVYLISMFKALCNGWIPPKYVTKEEYKYIYENIEKIEKYLVGWVGFNCSYSGKFFGGFAGICQTKNGIRNYQDEALRNIEKQITKMNGIYFCDSSYDKITIPTDAIIYCDPPYFQTTNYKTEYFNHQEFWNWVRLKSKTNLVFVSEYTAPEDFKCVYEKEAKSSLSANGKIGGNKVSIERLFRLK